MADDDLHSPDLAALRARVRALEAENAELCERQRDLAKLESRLANVLHMARIGSWELDLASRIADWSPETFRILGIPPHVTPTPADVVAICTTEADRDAIRNGLDAVQHHGVEPYDVMYNVRHPDGSEHAIHSRGDVVRHADGTPARIIGIVQDVTEQEMLRKQLFHSQKLETVGRLAAGLAHDLNNMLTVIQGSCDFVEAAVQGDELATEDVALIRDASERAAVLTRSLLAFSKQQVLQPEPTDVNAVVRSLEKLMHQLVGDAIAIRTTLGDPELVSVDPNQLSQVLLNLVANARDAMPEGGALAVETSCAVLPRELGEPRLHTRIRVRDSGHGMDETTRSRIFEPFFTTKGNRGTGLGLATAFGTIRQSGGHITVDSAPGRGATFDLYLPLVDVSLPPDAPSSRVPVAGARADARRILVVDDDTGVRKMIVRALQNAGYETIEATDADTALAMADDPVALVITDVMMPGMPAREMVTRLQARHEALPALFVSGYTGDSRLEDCGPRPGDAFLAKPFTPAELLQRVDAILHPCGEGDRQPPDSRANAESST